MARLGSIAAAPFVGDQFVSLYLGEERVPTVPGKPVIASAEYSDFGGGFEETLINFSDPINDGGATIDDWTVYINGVQYSGVVNAIGGPAGFANLFGFNANGQTVQVASRNAVGLGPRSNAVVVTAAF